MCLAGDSVGSWSTTARVRHEGIPVQEIKNHSACQNVF